jgi:hypothetical protein
MKTAEARKRQPAPFERVREALHVPGMPLEPLTRARLEAAFGVDVGHVRIHADASAARAARDANAAAFTIGRDIFFAAGEYAPETERGDAVLTHEVAHTLVDPRSLDEAAFDRIVETTTPGDAIEAGAEATVAAIRAGRVPAASGSTHDDARTHVARLAAGLIEKRDKTDPAQTVVTIVETILTTLASDPDDRLGRVRKTLMQLDERTQKLVFERLSDQMRAHEWHHLLLDVLTQPPPSGTADGDARELPAEDVGAPTVGEAPEQPQAAEPQAGDKRQEAQDAATSEIAKADEKTDEARARAQVATAAEEKTPEKSEAAAKSARRPAHPRLHGARARRAHAPARGAPRPPAKAGRGPAPAPPAGGEAAPEMAEADGGPAAPTAEPPAAAGAPAGAAAAAAPEAAAEPEFGAADPAEAVAPVAAPAARARVGAAPPAAETAPSAAPSAAGEAPAPSAAAPAPAETGAHGVAAPPESAAPTEAAPAAATPEASAEPEGSETEAARPAPAGAIATSEPAAAAEPAPLATAAPPESEAAGVAPSPSEAVTENSAEPSAPEAQAGAAPTGAAPPGAPPIGDLPPEQDDGKEETGGGGGGGAAIADQPEEPAPAPSADDPAAAMSTVADLPPAQMQTALGGVSAAADKSVAADRTDLAAHPPEATPPAAPPGQSPAAPPTPAAAAAPSINRVPDAAAPASAEADMVATDPAATPLPATPAPAVTSNAEGQVTAADAQNLQTSVDQLPVTDPALNVTAGPPPTVALEGAADPARAAQQRALVATDIATQATAAHQEAARPLGEDHIVPTKAPELVRGETPQAAGTPAALPAAAPVDVPVAIIAKEKSSDTVRAAAMGQAQQITSQRTEQQQKMTQQRADSQRDMDAQVAASATEQADERNRARGDVQGSRGEWNKAQSDTVTTADKDSDEQVSSAQAEATEQQKTANAEAQKNINDGNAQVTTARADAEKEARTEKDKAKNESKSSGFFSKLASAIGSFFDGICKAIHTAFEKARNLVKKAIAAAQKLAADVIDKARNVIVGAIKKAGEALIAIGDRVLAAFPALRDKFRAAIKKLVDTAVAVVNAIADKLKAAAKKLLDLLGKALVFILDAYEALYIAAIKVVADACKAAIDLANKIVQAVGAFAVLIKDIAANPGQWIRNLGSALMDGVKNHLWRELKAAIKEWFNSKVEAVVGIGKMIFEVLKKGGIPFKRIAMMVWVAVKAAIPRAIIEFLIQKVISMLIPAAAAIMAIIEGLQAAWATASRIVAAFESFFAFLKAVKGGNAGQKFAKAVAAAAIAVIDFTANFIISKIGKGAKGVGGKLKGIAEKIMAFFRKGIALVKRGAQAAKKVVGAVVRAVVKGAKAIGRMIKRAGKWIANSRIGKAIRNSRVGKFIGRQIQRAKAGYQKARERFKQWRENRKKQKGKTDADRLDRAVTELKPKLHGMLKSGISRPRLRLTLYGWRAYYRIRRLQVDGQRVVAANSPQQTVAELVALHGAGLSQLISSIGSRLLASPQVTAAHADLEAQRAAGAGTKKQPIEQSGGAALLGGAKDLSERDIAGISQSAASERREYFAVGKGTPPIYEHQSDVRESYSTLVGAGPEMVGSYENAHNVWQAIAKETGLKDHELAGSLQEFVRSGNVPKGPLSTSGNSKKLAEVARLMVSVEGGRSHGALVETPMLLELVKAGKAKPAQIFGVKTEGRLALLSGFTIGGAKIGQKIAQSPTEFPVFGAHAEEWAKFKSLSRAERARMPTEERERFKKIAAGQRRALAKSREVMKRRVKLYETFILHRMEVTGEVFDSVDSLSAFIERELKQLLEGAYGVTLPGIPATPMFEEAM